MAKIVDVEVDEKFIEKCGGEVSARHVLKMFAADLIATGPADISNGSDEQHIAKVYYDRCYFDLESDWT
jgi:hypothetical protein